MLLCHAWGTLHRIISTYILHQAHEAQSQIYSWSAPITFSLWELQNQGEEDDRVIRWTSTVIAPRSPKDRVTLLRPPRTWSPFTLFCTQCTVRVHIFFTCVHVYINSDPTLGHLRPDHHSHLLHCSTHISLSCVYINCAPELPVRPDHLLHLLHRSTHICVFCVLCSVCI